MVVFRRKLTAMLVAAAVFLGAVPMAFAADVDSHPSPSMAGMAVKSDMGPCDKNMPAPKSPGPCQDNDNCAGMLGCYISAALPPSEPPVLPAYVAAGEISSTAIDPASVSLQPAHPPPIA